jgi:uncharacterized protein
MACLGLGIGWRADLALAIERYPDLGFIELLVEDIPLGTAIPQPVLNLRERGVTVIPHGVSLSLGGAEPPDPGRLRRLAALARQIEAPLVSEHVAFVRAGGRESGHLLPPSRTEETLAIVVENVRLAQEALPVPLALENISSLFEWPEDEIGETEFLAELLQRTGVLLLLDVANLYANERNHGLDVVEALDRLPLDRIAYVHVGGGVEGANGYHDTHTRPVSGPVLSILEALYSRTEAAGVLLERDDHFPPQQELHDEMARISAAIGRGRARRPS